VPIGTGPGRRPAPATAPTDEPSASGPLAQATDPSGPAPPQERLLRSSDYPAEPALPPQKGRQRLTRSKTAPTSARERLRTERARLARRRRRIRVLTAGAGVIVLIAAAVAVGVLSHHNRGTTVKARSEYAGPYAPVTLNADNSVTMARPGVTKPVIDVYEDFQCPMCRSFEKANGGMIQQLADQGKVKVVYHPFTIFNAEPQQANSIRAWAAAKCAPANLWARYHNALYAGQPAETTIGGFPVSLLVRLGKDVGIRSRGFAQCVQSQKYAAQNPPVSSQIINGGVNDMLTLKLNGQVLSAQAKSSTLRRQILSAS